MTAEIKVVRTDRELECPRVDRILRDKGVQLVLLPEGVSQRQLLTQTRDADLILMCYTPIDKRVIDNAVNLKGIVKYGVGIDAIDIGAAMARNIPVVNVPQYAEETVAEGAFALMIALAKKLLPIHAQMNQCGWVWPGNHWLGCDLAGKTIGLVGTGRIGRSMARMAGAGFRMRVLGFDPYVDETIMQRHGIEKIADLDAMLGQCDVVTIHCVLNKKTEKLLGRKELAGMKSSATLINVSRGAIVDEQALLEALKSGKIAAAGLDVFSQEPLNRHHHRLCELYTMDNVLLFPHLTFYTEEAMQRLEDETLNRCFEILEGREVQITSTDPRLRAQVHGVQFSA